MADLNEILARYTFLPWMRRGMGNSIKEAENFNANHGDTGRPKVTVKVKIKPKKGADRDTVPVVERAVELIGPGDITGIDRQAIVKTEPTEQLRNFEPNYFPYIEFYEEDFPWRYTPAKAEGHKLRPWLALVVMEKHEFKMSRITGGPLPSFVATGTDDLTGAESAAFPAPEDSWAWAHVHLNADLTAREDVYEATGQKLSAGLNRLNDILDAEPDRAVSRLICPRMLKPQTAYTAFLIPAYEAGRLAGLGAPADLIDAVRAQKAAFGSPHATNGDAVNYVDRFPFYHQWTFQTGSEGDFEQLVRKLVPQEPHSDIGKRAMDIQDPGFGIGYDEDADPDEIHPTLDLEGALKVPEFSREPFPWPNSNDYRRRLADYLNLSEDLLDASFPANAYYNRERLYEDDGGDMADDPIVTADIYGRWHALIRRVRRGGDKWLPELNLDPRSRAAAGLGVGYVKENQETLMDKAWSQLGEVVEANRRIRWGQLAKEASLKGFEKNIKNQSPEQVTAITGRINRKLTINGDPALATLRKSALPMAMHQPAYRKMERPNGPLMKRLNPQGNSIGESQLRQSLASKALRVAPEKTFSLNQVTISNVSLAQNINQVSLVTQAPQASTLFFLASNNDFLGQAALPQQLGLLHSIGSYQAYFNPENSIKPPESEALNLGTVSNNFKQQLDPKVTLPKSILRGVRLRQSDGLRREPDRIVPVMAYPKFAEPVYEYLVKMGEDFLIPNLHLLPENSVTLLETNQRFIEAFMVGLNQEMGKELLWRRFPTDQRGSYFRQFWNSADVVNEQDLSPEVAIENVQDIHPIHEWARSTPLGSHNARPGIVAGGNLVLTIRGDLLKKYSDVVIYAQKAKWQDGDNDHKKRRELDEDVLHPIFGARVSPDIYLLGFALEDTVAKGDRATGDPGWFFVMRERPGEIRFGYDEESEDVPALQTWLDLNEVEIREKALNGDHLDPNADIITLGNTQEDKPASDKVPWGKSAAHMAQILYQNPFVICIHADEMLR